MKARDFLTDSGAFDWASWFEFQSESNAEAITTMRNVVMEVMKRNLALEAEIAKLRNH